MPDNESLKAAVQGGGHQPSRGPSNDRDEPSITHAFASRSDSAIAYPSVSNLILPTPQSPSTSGLGPRDRVDLLGGHALPSTKPFPLLIEQQRSELRSTAGQPLSPSPPPGLQCATQPHIPQIIPSVHDSRHSQHESLRLPNVSGGPSYVAPLTFDFGPEHQQHQQPRIDMQTSQPETSMDLSPKLYSRSFPPSSYLFQAAASVAASDAAPPAHPMLRQPLDGPRNAPGSFVSRRPFPQSMQNYYQGH